MASIDKIRKNRIKKLEAIKKAGMSPYPARTKRTHTISEAILNFDKFEKAKKRIFLAGRIRLMRPHGRSCFLHFEDGSLRQAQGKLGSPQTSTARIQAYLKSDTLGEKKYQFFLDNFDIGDFIEIEGALFKTKTGEKTIQAQNYAMLAKSLRPLPEKWHGLKDEEIRFRKRYLDFIFNPEVREIFYRKARFWGSMREFLKSKGFLEVETPILEITAGGADANPFVTHHDALDIDVYLRISMGELWQKRLMVGGFEKTFEIGRQFRNEGISKEHLQDYTQMEFYWAYVDYKDGMNLVEEMYKYVIKQTFETLKFKIFDFNVDFSKKWKRIDYRETILSKFKIDIDNASLKEVRAKLDELRVEYDKNAGLERLIDVLWKERRKDIVGPVFVVGHPVLVSPLAKRDPKRPSYAERFQVVLAGSEVGNGYSELNNPLDQAERFREQARMREKGDLLAQMHDKDFVQALEYGMPPTCGFGVSERLFSFLMNRPIRECVTFPLMRPKEDFGESNAGVNQAARTNKEMGAQGKAEGIFYIDGEVKEKFSGIKAGVALIKGVRVKKKIKELEDYKKKVFKDLKGLKTQEVGKIPTIQAYCKLFKAFGIDPHSRRPAPEALLRRVASGKSLYQVNNVVDAYNLAVLQTGVSLGAFDLDKLVLPKVLRFAKKGEKIVLLGEDKLTMIHKGELVYADQKGPITLDLNYRDCDRTKIAEKTKNILLVADGCKGISVDEIQKALDLGCELITKFASGKVVKKFIAE